MNDKSASGGLFKNMDLKTIALTAAQIAEEKGLLKEKVFEILAQALAAAYKKEYGRKGQKIEAAINPQNGQLKFWQTKEVLDQSRIYTEEELAALKKTHPKSGPEEPEEAGETGKVRFNPERHIMLEEVRKTNPQIQVGQAVKFPLETQQDFGRIATQTAKQVILQRLREAEREVVLQEYQHKQEQAVSGVVQRVEDSGVFVDLGKAVGFLPRSEQAPGEFYRPGQRIKLFLLEVQDSIKGPQVLLSRVHPKLVSRLFELEVPELSSEQIEIKSIAREPGSRTKIAVFSKEEGLDPVGSFIGQRGSRVGAVIAELGGEKIDIIEYSPDQEQFIKNALAPAKVLAVKIMPKNTAIAIVDSGQLSLAIGREGQNVRLAAKLTGWKIDVKAKESEPVEAKPTESGARAPVGQEPPAGAETQAKKKTKSKNVKDKKGKKKSDESKA